MTRSKLDPKALRLRLADLPSGYHPGQQAYLDLCDLEGHPDPRGPPSPGTELTPQSPAAEVGKAYPFQLYTHCGVGFAVDFDHSFWDLADAGWQGQDGNPPPGIGNPYQAGTMTLVDPEHARFDFAGGSIHFTRHIGPKIVPGLCS